MTNIGKNIPKNGKKQSPKTQSYKKGEKDMTTKEILNLAREALYHEKENLYKLQKVAVKYNYKKVVDHCRERIDQINTKIAEINTIEKAYDGWEK